MKVSKNHEKLMAKFLKLFICQKNLNHEMRTLIFMNVYKYSSNITWIIFKNIKTVKENKSYYLRLSNIRGSFYINDFL